MNLSVFEPIAEKLLFGYHPKEFCLELEDKILRTKDFFNLAHSENCVLLRNSNWRQFKPPIIS